MKNYDDLDKYADAWDAKQSKKAALDDLDSYVDTWKPEEIVAAKKDSGLGENIVRALESSTLDIGGAGVKGLNYVLNKAGYPSETLQNTESDIKDIGKRNENLYGKNLSYNIARTGEDIGATLPLMAIGGAALGAAPGIGAAGEAINGATQGNRLLQLLAKGAGIATKGAAQGAAGNLLTSGTSDQPASESALQGAKVGAPLALLGAGVVNPLAKYAGNKIGDMISSPDNYATKKVLQALSRDQVGVDEVGNRLNHAGDQARIADVAGANTLQLADTAASVPGEGQQKIVQFLNQRQTGQQDRLLSAATTGLKINPEVGYEGAVDDLMASRKEAAAPLYEKAFNAAPVNNDRINQFLKDPILQSGLNKGLQIQRLESLADGKPFNPSDYAITGFNDNGDPIIGAVPNMRLLDSAKKGLDSIIAENTNQVGKVNELGRAVTKVKNSYLNELDNINPDYAAARSAWSDPSQSLNAMDMGSKFIKNGAYGNAKELAKMPDTDKEFFRIGVGKSISDILDGTREGNDAANRLFATPKMQKALQSVFPDNDSFQQFEKSVRNEMQLYKNKQDILGNSKSFKRFASAMDAGEEPPVNVSDLANAARGNYAGAALSIGSKIKNKLTQISPEKANALTNLLFSENPQLTVDQLRSVAQKNQESPLIDLIRRNYLPATSIGINRSLNGAPSSP